jgi:hypothetical protein
MNKTRSYGRWFVSPFRKFSNSRRYVDWGNAYKALISGFRRDVDVICGLLLSFVESRPVKMGPTRCPETSVNNYLTTPCNHPFLRGISTREDGTDTLSRNVGK